MQMRLGKFLVLFWGVALLCTACSNSESASSVSEAPKIEVEGDSLAGMLLVKSSGKVVLLGTDDENAKVNERPSMESQFGYDFSMGRTEVTCDEFNSLMAPATGLLLPCAADFPATNVSFYDAVLFANERSKSEGFDTAYTYTRAVFDTENHCTTLEGFAYRPEISAYRLPTEAEWILVAQANWNLEKSWTAENSDYKLHSVCSKEDSPKQFCDLLGNAMEWANDWLGKFRDTTVVDYVGAPDGGTLGMRVVKGGSYRNSKIAIALFSRGDVYTVTSATRADYVGFRLAFGAVPEATWMGNNGKAVSSRIVPLASSSTLRSFSGTYKVKLAFRNDVTGNLAYVDYSSGILSVVEIEDSIETYHPEISPDGKHVAFCSGLEGVSGESSVYVRDLDANGANLVKLDVPSAAIPRWRVLESGDTVIVYVTSAGNNENQESFKSASTWRVKFENGRFGTPQKLFDGAYHGGVSADNRLAVTGARLLRAKVAEKGSTLMQKARDTVWYKDGDKEEQACNASLANDGSKRTLFLDFGGTLGQSFVGERYKTHERMLIVDSTGKLIQSVGAPTGYTFDHSEWVAGGNNLVVATLTNVDGAHPKVVLVNLTDSSVTELVEGDELWHPSLWVNQNASATGDVLLDLDSAGIYFIEGQDWEHESVGFKMSMLWKYKDDVEILCVGSSRIEDGVIVKKIQSGFALNMGHPRNDMNASLYVAENYGLNHLKKLKTIVVSIDFDLWLNTTGFSDLLFPDEPGYIYDLNHSFWKGEEMDGFAEIIESVVPFTVAVRNAYAETRGWLSNASVGWGEPLVELDSNWSDVQMDALAWNLNHLSEFVKRMGENHINVVAVVFPLNPAYRNTGAWGRYGLRRSVAEVYLKSVADLAKENPHFTLLDENKSGAHDYPDEMALNTDHLSASGAERLTSRLDSLLKTLN